MKKMKKLFTLALALLCGMGAMADDYTGHLVLVRGGETIQDQEKVATLTRLDNGQYTLSVDNLTYEAAGMGIGNVDIDSIDAVGNPDQPGVTDLGVAKSIRISSGTISGFPVWVGPRLGAVPIELEGKVAEVATGDLGKALKAAHEAVEKQEDHHLYHTKGWSRELAIEALGMPAVLPPPEEVKKVETAIGASRAEQQREAML